MEAVVIDPVLEELSRLGWTGLERTNLPGLSTHTPLPATEEALAALEQAWAGPAPGQEQASPSVDGDVAAEGGSLE